MANRRLPVNRIVDAETARRLTEISTEINRQVGLLVDRRGYISSLIVGDSHQVFLPDLKRQRIGSGRLRGLRLVHTHLYNEPLTDDDITDLVILRLDLVAAITADEKGLPRLVHGAHVNPDLENGESHVLLKPVHPARLDEDYDLFIGDLENQIRQRRSGETKGSRRERAILVGLELDGQGRSLEDSLLELQELCRTADIEVVDIFRQRRNSLHPKTAIGKGKLKEIVFHSIRYDCELLIFDRELSPAQAKNLSDFSDLKIIDRTQLILDIFARHAKSRDGKLQVELAQLRYLRSRLSEKDDNMSRLTGGIGGRGPGETKLEIGRRRVSDRIAHLEKQLKQMGQRRGLNRKNRFQSGVPQMSIIGYTNAGKSTLLNAMSESDVMAENLLFATLDPTTRRIRFPRHQELVVADTVGFIHELPAELVNAFRATLEELGVADLLLHVIDASDERFSSHIAAVETILSDLDVLDKPRLLVFNKIDALDAARLEQLHNLYPEAAFVSAIAKTGMDELLEQIQERVYGSLSAV